MAVLEREVVEIRTMVAGADRDVADYRAEMRAHKSALMALRDTQLEQGAKLDDLRETQIAHYAEHKADITALRTELRTGLAGVRNEFRTGLAEVRTELRTELAEVKTGLARVEADVTEIKIGIAKIATLFPSITLEGSGGN